MFRPLNPRGSRNDSATGPSSEQVDLSPLEPAPHCATHPVASPKSEASYRKRFPDSLRFNPGSFRRHSRARSSSSVSSALVLDSDTTYSISTVASPIGSSYTSESVDTVGTSLTDKAESWNSMNDQNCEPQSMPSGSTLASQGVEDDVPGFDHLVLNTPEVVISLDNSTADNLGKADEADSPMTEKRLSQPDELTDDALRTLQQESAVSPGAQPWDTASVVTEETREADADTVLNYTLQLVYGAEVPERRPVLAHLRRLSAKFIEEVGEEICQDASSDEHPSQPSNTMTSSSSTSTLPDGGRGSSASGSGKRKQPDEEDDGYEKHGDGQGSGSVPAKKARPNFREDENLRLSCPFRKRNPHRFNVRDHHSCAMTYFPKFSELRQHIVRQHKRDDPSAFVCDRCNCDFQTRKELRDHQRLPRHLMCDIADHDPESGIDGPTCNKLLSRKRASGTSPEVQWKEIWNHVFPDDDDSSIRPFHFIPVIEHFELVSQFSQSFNRLRSSLEDKISNPTTLETLSTIFHQCFIETVDNCLLTAQDLPYVNRSNKRNDIGRSQGVAPLAFRNVKRAGQIQPRPDSGVVLDDGSEGGSSVTDSALRHSDSMATIQTLDGRSTPILKDTPSSSVLSVPPSYPNLSTPAALSETALAVPMDSMSSIGHLFLPEAGFVQADHTQTWNDGLLYHMMGDSSTVATHTHHKDGHWAGQPAQYLTFPETGGLDTAPYL